MPKISVIQGDEYRAKIEKEVKREAFFFNVYKRAMDCVRELGEHAELYQEKETKEGIQYRIGNNIIVFCGERGQGKTSAMHSFSQMLKTTPKVEGISKPDKNFFILDTIDPSSLSEEESVIRVFISKLFNCVQDTMDKEIGKEDTAASDLMHMRQKLMVAFKTCYQNVDYSVNTHKDDYGMDDLEILSQLGSSGALRSNLETLIGSFLELVGKYGPSKLESKKSYDYLVIQIDDTDMAVGNAFKICDDIRNYFSLPNVIVLMASDMEQLMRTIEQEYIHRNHELITIRSNGARADHIQNCNKMAMQYIEKMFPAGHRIELPRLQEYLQRHHENLILEYWVKDKTGKPEKKNIFQDYKSSNNIQQQLLKFLYDRTGLIFRAEAGKLHAFLPRRMRELTHLLKLLSSMHEIDFDKIHPLSGKVNEEVRKLQDNLKMLEEYFFEFWCTNHLKEELQEQIVELREKDVAILEETLVKMEENKETVAASVILRTILWNKKFADALDDKQSKEEMIVYCRNCMEEWQKQEEEVRLGFRILRYDYTEIKLREKTTLERDRNIAFYMQNDKGDWLFDALNPLLQILENSDNGNVNTGTEIDSTQEADPVTDKGLNMLYNDMKQLFANVEVYKNVTSEIVGFYEDLKAKKQETTVGIKAIYEAIYGCLDHWHGDFQYLGDDSKADRIGLYMKKMYQDNIGIHLFNFWGNDTNYKYYEQILDFQIHNGIKKLRMDIDVIKQAVVHSQAASATETLELSGIPYESVIDGIAILKEGKQNGDLTTNGEELYNRFESYKIVLTIRDDLSDIQKELTDSLNDANSDGMERLADDARKSLGERIKSAEEQIESVEKQIGLS